MKRHTPLHFSLDRFGMGLDLACQHDDPADLKWFGHYDESGTLTDSEPGGECWAKGWADAESAMDCFRGELTDPTFPIPVDCWFDGECFVIEVAS